MFAEVWHEVRQNTSSALDAFSVSKTQMVRDLGFLKESSSEAEAPWGLTRGPPSNLAAECNTDVQSSLGLSTGQSDQKTDAQR